MEENESGTLDNTRTKKGSQKSKQAPKATQNKSSAEKKNSTNAWKGGLKNKNKTPTTFTGFATNI